MSAQDSHRDRALVVHGGVEREGEGVAGADVDGLGGRAVGADVAPQVVGAQVRHGRVVVGVLADVLEDRVLGAARRELLEDVVRRHVADRQRQGGDAQECPHF